MTTYGLPNFSERKFHLKRVYSAAKCPVISISAMAQLLSKCSHPPWRQRHFFTRLNKPVSAPSLPHTRKPPVLSIQSRFCVGKEEKLLFKRPFQDSTDILLIQYQKGWGMEEETSEQEREEGYFFTPAVVFAAPQMWCHYRRNCSAVRFILLKH